MSGLGNECENLFERVTYLFMVIFFIFGIIFFQKFKVSIPKENTDENFISRTDEDDKIKGFFADFDEPPKRLKVENH